jgi:uncharacterized protein
VAGVYETAVDRESAYEKLKGKVVASGAGTAAPAGSSSGGWMDSLGWVLGSGGPRRDDTVLQAAVKSAARTMGSTVGRQLIRGVLGSLVGGSSKR